MATTKEQIDKTRERINAKYDSTYKYDIWRCRRSFRYSDRRLFRQSKFYAIQALPSTATMYVNFLGPSGVTLAAFDGATDSSVKTWLRYPVSYRRRMRFFSTLAEYNGSTEEAKGTETIPDKLVGEKMRVFMGTPDEVELFIALLKGGAVSCVAAAKYSGDNEAEKHKAALAKKVCGSQYRKWNNPDVLDKSWDYLA